jgi:hypothetical protein
MESSPSLPKHINCSKLSEQCLVHWVHRIRCCFCVFVFVHSYSNYLYACSMPSLITPMSRIHHGRCAIISTHAQCLPGSRRCPGSIMGGLPLFLRMRNAHLDHADVKDPSWEVSHYFYACAMPTWSKIHHER